jgi:hypothetical protein
VTDEAAAAMVKAADVDGDGRINLQEFKWACDWRWGLGLEDVNSI